MGGRPKNGFLYRSARKPTIACELFKRKKSFKYVLLFGELSLRNAELNGVTNRHFFHGMDAFDFLKSSKELYDIVILDPPAFAKHLSSVDKAMIGYRNLNTEGFNKVLPGGLLFTFSCSQVIDKTLFRKISF